MNYPKEGNCYFCGNPYDRWGHNPAPLADYKQRCCDICNEMKVVPARIERAMRAAARGYIAHRKDDK